MTLSLFTRNINYVFREAVRPPFFFIMATKFNEVTLNTIEEKFSNVCNSLLPDSNYGVYDLRYLSGSSTLRLFITKNNDVRGVDINDCVNVDRILSPLIETEDWIPSNFVLEVSSPGIYRDIRTSHQLKYSVNELIKIKFNSSIDEKALKNKHLVATLKEFSDSEMHVVRDDNNEKMNIKYELVKSVNAELKI